MSENNRIEIALSKAKLTKLLFFSIIFLGVGLWMIVSNPATSNPVFNNLVVKAIAAYGGVVMGVLGVYFFGKKLFDTKPGLVIDENGIYDNTSAFTFGLIPWRDVSKIYERTVQASVASKQRFVTIGLVDPEKYIAREKNGLKRKLLAANSKSHGSPIHISTNGLKTSHAELLKILTEEFDKHKPQN
jgi:hypothetical protein